MEGRLNNFERDHNTIEQFSEIENRYKTAEGISERLIDQVKSDYNIVSNLTPNGTVTKEKIRMLLDHIKDIYPDIKFLSLEETLFPHKDVEQDILQSIEEIN